MLTNNGLFAICYDQSVRTALGRDTEVAIVTK